LWGYKKTSGVGIAPKKHKREKGRGAWERLKGERARHCGHGREWSVPPDAEGAILPHFWIVVPRGDGGISGRIKGEGGEGGGTRDLRKKDDAK